MHVRVTSGKPIDGNPNEGAAGAATDTGPGGADRLLHANITVGVVGGGRVGGGVVGGSAKFVDGVARITLPAVTTGKGNGEGGSGGRGGAVGGAVELERVVITVEKGQSSWVVLREISCFCAQASVGSVGEGG